MVQTIKTLRSQTGALRKQAAPPLLIFTDTVSGSKKAWTGLERFSMNSRTDTLIVWRLDRLGRSLPHLIGLVNDLRERGIGFRSLRDGVIDNGNLVWRTPVLFTPLRALHEVMNLVNFAS